MKVWKILLNILNILLYSLPPKSFGKYGKIYLYSEIIKKSKNFWLICFISWNFKMLWNNKLGKTIDDIKYLSLLGQDKYVISLYYQKNKDWKTKYLD